MNRNALPLGLLAGYAADVVFADPRRGHPVAAFGSAATAFQRRVYADSRSAGVAYASGCVAGVAALGVLLARASRRRPMLRVAMVAASTWAVLGGTSLGREARRIGDALTADDLDGARDRLPHLCARDPEDLSSAQVARAVVESVAENTSDAVVAPLFWGAVLGIPGLLAYRASNTLDAMVGYRNKRYLRFGWAAARLDDVLNFLPARLTGLITVALAGSARRDAWAALRRDGAKHPSPNAGRCEAAAAGALGLRLGGMNTYGELVEHRPELGTGRAPSADDVERAVRLSKRVGFAAVVICAAGAMCTRRR